MLALAGGWLLAVLPLAAAPPLREAPNPGAVAIDQLSVSGNACGPAALLNAFRFGDKSWQRAATAVAGDSDRARLLTLIKTWGLRPSQSLPGRKRWSRHGVNADDLCDIANEMARAQLLPRMTCEVLMTTPGESPHKLLARAHSRMAASLAKGLPPVISIRRLALRKAAGKPPEWVVLQGHFVTITGIPRKLEKNAESFAVSYLDPWGARRGTGRLAISTRAFVTAANATSPCLEADFPQAEVGKKLVRPSETTLLTLAAGIGKW